MPIIVSIVRFPRGLETLAHFLHSRAAVCMGCGAWDCDKVAPVSLLDGGEVDPDAGSGWYLCKACSMSLPMLSDRIRAEWPDMTALEVERVWSQVRREQVREADAILARKGSTQTTVEKQAKPETVLVLRTCNSDMTGYGGFKWPESGPVEAPDWNPVKSCGQGLHGWLWGAGDWRLKSQDPGARWLVVEVQRDQIVDLEGKVKFPRGVVVAVCSKWADAMSIIRPKMPIVIGQIASGNSGHAAASGNYGHAAASGNSGHAAASGNYGHAAASGNYGHAAASGNSGHAAASGNYGHAAASGNSGHAAASGNYGWAVAGLDGRVMAGNYGAITCLWHDGKRKRVLVGYVGEDGIVAGQWYAVKVTNGAAAFVPVSLDCRCAPKGAK